jgi:hypothetical protein
VVGAGYPRWSSWLPAFAGVGGRVCNCLAPSSPRYIELNPVRAKLARRAEDWQWSSAAAHFAGSDASGLLCLERWSELFGNPSTIAEDWRVFVEGPGAEARANARRLRRWATGSAWNRPMGWVAPVVVLRAGSPPG